MVFVAVPPVWVCVAVPLGIGGLWPRPERIFLCLRGIPRDPADTRDPKIGGCFSAPSYEAQHALRASHPGVVIAVLSWWWGFPKSAVVYENNKQTGA